MLSYNLSMPLGCLREAKPLFLISSPSLTKGGGHRGWVAKNNLKKTSKILGKNQQKI